MKALGSPLRRTGGHPGEGLGVTPAKAFGVTPAEAGVQTRNPRQSRARSAFAGMTTKAALSNQPLQSTRTFF